jgi:hypothetical protein
MRNSDARAPRSVLVTVLIAVVVTVGVLITVVVLRARADVPVADAPGADQAAGIAPAKQNCGQVPCVQLAAETAGGMEVALLAAPDGSSGRVRFGPAAVNTSIETSISAIGARLGPDSLRCREGVIVACLVRGTGDGGTMGEVLVYRGDSWEATEKPYFSDANNISLSDAVGDSSPEVIVVRHECPGRLPGSASCAAAPVLATVFDIRGAQLGCTKKYTSPTQLRGWPDVKLVKSDVRACP